MRLVGHGCLLVLPLLLWLDYLRSIYRSLVLTGADQVAVPFLGFLSKWQITASQFATSGWGSPARNAMLALVGATIQAVALVAWADWRNLWWRVGAVFVLVMLTTDPVVWEGYPGAYTRVLLPMTLAFNLLLPGRKWFWPLLVLGNLSVIPGIQAMRIPLVWRLF